MRMTRRIKLQNVLAVIACFMFGHTLVSHLRNTNGGRSVTYGEDNFANKRLLRLPKYFDQEDDDQEQTYKHLLDWGFPLDGSLSAPKPAFRLGRINGHTDYIIGVPTVRRHQGDYLIGTLNSLLRNRTSVDTTFKLVVFIADTNQSYVEERCEQILNNFKREIDNGELEVISPPDNYYPDWDTSITNTLNDPLERVKWRSKENLDAVFVMMYIYQLSPTYYLMLEDDFRSDKGYDEFIVEKTNKLKTGAWFFLSYSGWFSSGKLFRTVSVPSFASFVHMFWNKKPIDWLQVDYARTAYCADDGKKKACQSILKQKMIPVQPYVFHHIGKFSSLKGKVQDANPEKKRGLGGLSKQIEQLILGQLQDKKDINVLDLLQQNSAKT